MHAMDTGRYAFGSYAFGSYAFGSYAFGSYAFGSFARTHARTNERTNERRGKHSIHCGSMRSYTPMKISEDLSEGIDGFIEQTLMRGCDDYVMAAHLVDTTFYLEPLFRDSVAPELLQELSEAERVGGQIEFTTARAVSLAIIGKVLTEGLMEIGDLYYQGFHPWPVSIEAALQRVRSEWEELAGHLPDPGLYWLRITERGEAIGQPALQRWQQERARGR